MTIDPRAQAMYDDDPSAKEFGIELIEASPAGAVVTMTVTDEMCNGYAIGHGGMTFLIADSAMAFASNSGIGDDQAALATSAGIDWFAPAEPGRVVTATCRHTSGGGRSKVWDVEVVDDHGIRLALFRGRTQTITRR